MGVPTPQYSAAITGRLMMYQGNELVSVSPGISTSGANVPLLNGANTWTGRQIFSANVTGNSGMATATENLGEFEVTGNGTGAAMIAFHRPGAVGRYFGIDTDNQWKVGGWSVGANAYKIWHDGDATKSFATAGYQKLPSGLIIQWLLATSIPSSGAAYNLPIAFPTAFLSVVATHGDSPVGGTAAQAVTVFTQSLSTVGIASGTGGAVVGAYIFAIGY